MLPIAVCDDDYQVYVQIKEFLSRYSIQRNRETKTAYFETAQALLSAPADYAILFLDIMLDAGYDGIAVGKELRKQGNNALFIMTTSRADRALDSFGATVFRYLIKPLEPALFFSVLDDLYVHLELDRDIYVLKKGRQVEYIPYKDILYFESYKRQRYIVAKTRVYPTTTVWEKVIEPLGGKPGFFSANNTCVIHLKHVTGHTVNGVTMADNQFVKLKAGRYAQFISALSDYFQMGG